MSAWSGHVPFARDLVSSLKPARLVELGTHYGESYFTLCESVLESGCSCTCYAVDTWRGDSQTGTYTEEVFDDVARHNSEYYSWFSYLLRMTFDEALEKFSDESIDLLHIDGHHAYSSVKHDWQEWFAKVAPGGVVLFHDTAMRGSDFGVWKLWEEVAGGYESFEFQHGFGLGVVRKPGCNKSAEGILEYLFAPENAGPIRRYYSLCADRLAEKRALALSPKGSSSAFQEGSEVAILPLTKAGLILHDWSPEERRPGAFRALTADPWILCPLNLDSRLARFFLMVMSCNCEAPKPTAQLFWKGSSDADFNEARSFRLALIADGNPHLYWIDLDGSDGRGIQFNWAQSGRIDLVRLDPLDTPGTFSIAFAAFSSREPDGRLIEPAEPPISAAISDAANSVSTEELAP